VIIVSHVNMAVPFMESTKEQERFLIRFLSSEGVRTGEVYGNTLLQ